MKVTIFTLEFPPYIYGGVGVHLSNLTRYLVKFVDIEVRTVLTENSLEEEYWNNIKVKRYSPWSSLLNKTVDKFKPVFKGYSLSLAFVSEDIDSDIVHFHTWYTALGGLYAKKLYDVKLVSTVHSLEPLRPWKREALGTGYNLSMWAERNGLMECDLIIAVSEGTKKDIIKSYGIGPSKITVIHNGIDETLWKPIVNEEVLRKYGITKPYVLFVGRLTKQKGVETLLEAAKILPNHIKIVLVTGKEDDKLYLEKIRSIVSKIRNVVWIHKMLPKQDIIPIYTQASVFVCPSIYEPFGIVNLEAMATETPVVATNVGGIPEIVVDGKTGFLVEPNSPEILAAKILEIINNPDLAEKMGKEGRKRVLEEFCWRKIAEKTYNAYRKVIGG